MVFFTVLCSSCPGYVSRPWRVRKEYLIYNYGTSESATRAPPIERQITNNKRQNASSRHNKANSDLRAKRVSHNGSHYQQHATESTPAPADANDEIDCLAAFHAVYHELQLVRTVRRQRDFLSGAPESTTHHHQQHKGKKKRHNEQSLLYLGNIHPHLEQRASYRPTSYQPPLVRHEHHEVRFSRSNNISTSATISASHVRPANNYA